MQYMSIYTLYIHTYPRSHPLLLLQVCADKDHTDEVQESLPLSYMVWGYIRFLSHILPPLWGCIYIVKAGRDLYCPVEMRLYLPHLYNILLYPVGCERGGRMFRWGKGCFSWRLPRVAAVVVVFSSRPVTHMSSAAFLSHGLL